MHSQALQTVYASNSFHLVMYFWFSFMYSLQNSNMFFLSQNNVERFNGKLTFLERFFYWHISAVKAQDFTFLLINKLKILGYKNEKERTANAYLCGIMHIQNIFHNFRQIHAQFLNKQKD